MIGDKPYELYEIVVNPLLLNPITEGYTAATKKLNKYVDHIDVVKNISFLSLEFNIEVLNKGFIA